MNLNITRTADGQLKLAGALDIYSASSLRDSLQDAFQSTGPIRLDLADVSGGDVTGLQLLFSGRKTASSSGREFVVTSLSPAIREAGTSLGLDLDSITHN